MKTPVLVAVGAVDAIIVAMSSPSKADELAILRDCIAKLGPDSYCGPWLREQLPCLEQDMRSDIFPQHTYSAAKAEAERIVAEAKAKAAELISAAQDKANDIDRKSNQAMNEAASGLRQALRALERF
jgi:cell division septum initiation protein DivIVA